MAERLIYHSTNNLENPFEKDVVQFEWYSGFSKVQKNKTLNSLKQSVNQYLKDKDKSIYNWLEVSTISDKDLGQKMSAKNLTFTAGFEGVIDKVENIYQQSKVFDSTGKVIGFKYMEKNFPTEPKTFYYDYLYCLALLQNGLYHNEITYYDYFTDLPFNHTKGKINTQARAAALFKTLLVNQKQCIVSDYNKFHEYYLENVKTR